MRKTDNEAIINIDSDVRTGKKVEHPKDAPRNGTKVLVRNVIRYAKDVPAFCL
jgi:hypothetical protein